MDVADTFKRKRTSGSRQGYHVLPKDAIPVYGEQDPMLNMLEWLCAQLMEAEVSNQLGAEKHGQIQWINPATAVENGNRRVHGMDDLLWTGRDGRRLKISLPDALPASLGSPERLDFGGDIIYDTAFMNICIILWGTNFKMWYEEDILRCFIIETPAEKAEQGVHQSYLSSGCARARKRWYCASHVASFRGR